MLALKGTLEDKKASAKNKVPEVKKIRSPIKIKKSSEAHESVLL